MSFSLQSWPSVCTTTYGSKGKSINDSEKKKELPSDTKGSGVEVWYVTPGSAAFYSGIEPGDVITHVGKHLITNTEELQNILIPYGSNLISTVTVLNENSETPVEHIIYFEERPEYPGTEVFESDVLANAFYPVFGMKLMATSSPRKRQYIITDIVKGSIADESGFSVNDPVEIIKTRQIGRASCRERVWQYV